MELPGEGPGQICDMLSSREVGDLAKETQQDGQGEGQEENH